MVLCDIVDDAAAAAAAFDRAVVIENYSSRWLLERTLLISMSSKRVFSRLKMDEIRIVLYIESQTILSWLIVWS